MKKLILGLILQIIFQAAQASDYYWVNGTGNWSDFANHWATTSGGNSFHTQSPQPADNVYFDDNSFAALGGDTVTLDLPIAFCNNFNWQTTFSGNDLVSSPGNQLIKIFGSIDIWFNTNLSFTGMYSLESANSGNTINMLDTSYAKIILNNPTGEWTLTAPIFLQGDLYIRPGTLQINYGTLNTSGYQVTCSHFISNNWNSNRVLDAGGSEFFIRSFEYYVSMAGPGPYSASWEVDSLLQFGGPPFNLYFMSAETADTSLMSIAPWFNCPMKMQSFDQTYQHIYCISPGYFYGYPVVSKIEIGAHDVQINSFKSENVSIIMNSFSLQADTVKCVSTVPVTTCWFESFYNIDIDYLEGPEMTINFGVNSNLPQILSPGCITLAWIYSFPLGQHVFGSITAGKCFNYSPGPNFNIPKCVIGENGNFGGSCFFDTLMFSPGFHYTITAGDTVTVNESFIATGSQQDPILLNSSTPWSQATMMFADSVCLDYLYIQDMVAIGSYVNAGANSIDISNNSGWLYTACSLVSNVWPGDANYDLIVNNADLLPIGIAWGETGPVRPNASIAYIAQPSTDWNSSFTNAVNKKHADCDGNGLIDGADTLAITANYNMTHLPLAPSGQKIQQGTIDLYFQLPAQVLPGTVLSIPVMLGTSIAPAVDFYGASFSITFDPAFVVPGSVSVDYSGSWMISPGNAMHMEKDFASTGIIDMALTRTDHQDVSGQGMIAVVSFAVAPNASGNFLLGFTNTLFINHDGTVIPVNPVNSGIVAGISRATASVNAVCFPNPFNSEATLLFPNPENEQFSLTITDAQGRILKPIQQSSNDRFTINRSDLSNGIYFYELKNVDGTKSGTGKFVVY